MPRKQRQHAPGMFHHVTMRGTPAEPLYADDHDRWRFLGILSDVTRECDWRCLAFCLMTTHYHLLVQEQQIPLAKPMQWLNSRYAIAVNSRHDRIGHLFAGRYADTIVKSNEHLLAAVVYVARNPCEAGLCANAEDWPWSSYRALVGHHRPWSFISAPYVFSLLSLTPSELRDVVNQGSDPVPGSDPGATRGATRR